MRLRWRENTICVEFTPAEARVFLDELSHVRGGARLPKIRQVCKELESVFEIEGKNSTAGT